MRYSPVQFRLTLRQDRGGQIAPPPLVKVRNLLKIGAPEARPVFFQFLKFSYTLFGTIPGPPGVTGGKWRPPAAARVVIGHS